MTKFYLQLCKILINYRLFFKGWQKMEPWEDPEIQGFMREWTYQVERCVRREHPCVTIDRFGRRGGQTKSGPICLNPEPDGIPQGIKVSDREYYHLWFKNKEHVKYYPHTVREYIDLRLAGNAEESLRGCVP